MSLMFSIGELSRVTGLSVKTIRLYGEKGLLPPAEVRDGSGYRYYDARNVERARVIKALRDLEFSLADIAEMLKMGEDEADIVSFLEAHKEAIARKVARYQHIHHAIETILRREREAAMTEKTNRNQVQEKTVGELLVAGVRAKGVYSDAGKRFGRLGRAVGRFICGHAMGLFYDGEYKEQDADFECCFPLKKAVEKEGIHVRRLPGGRCVSLVHLGPYSELGRSYARLFEYVREKNLEPQVPSREVYIKGPGMIFKGNPKKYVTEIQVFVN